MKVALFRTQMIGLMQLNENGLLTWDPKAGDPNHIAALLLLHDHKIVAVRELYGLMMAEGVPPRPMSHISIPGIGTCVLDVIPIEDDIRHGRVRDEPLPHVAETMDWLRSVSRDSGTSLLAPLSFD